MLGPAVALPEWATCWFGGLQWCHVFPHLSLLLTVSPDSNRLILCQQCYNYNTWVVLTCSSQLISYSQVFELCQNKDTEENISSVYAEFSNIGVKSSSLPVGLVLIYKVMDETLRYWFGFFGWSSLIVLEKQVLWLFMQCYHWSMFNLTHDSHDLIFHV